MAELKSVIYSTSQSVFPDFISDFYHTIFSNVVMNQIGEKNKKNIPGFTLKDVKPGMFL